MYMYLNFVAYFPIIITLFVALVVFYLRRIAISTDIIANSTCTSSTLFKPMSFIITDDKCTSSKSAIVDEGEES